MPTHRSLLVFTFSEMFVLMHCIYSLINLVLTHMGLLVKFILFVIKDPFLLRCETILLETSFHNHSPHPKLLGWLRIILHFLLMKELGIDVAA